uniref:Tudor and KH domain containing n=1 Tax=Podarcis muralis TaxID=64176 RepID=A0A670K6P8_PODMU
MASEKGSWSSLTMLQKVALALGVPASGAILYILYRRYRESQEERVTFVGEEELQVEMKVPKDAVKLLIGRHGANVKQLRKETQARIDVDVEDCGEERLIRICGSAVQVCKAKAAIHQILEENMAVTEKILVPQRAVGRIIGRGGETVRAIHQSTGAKIDCDREGSFSLTRQITLSGTRKEVLAAKKLIAEKVLEDEAFHKKLSHSALARSQRKQPLGTRKEDAGGSGDRRGDLPCTGEAFHQPLGTPRQEGAAGKFPEYPPEEPQELRSEGGSSEESLSETSCLSYAFEVPSPDFSFHANEHLEVYVSASESPNHFWIQIIGSRTFQLDKLTREMTQYYDSGLSAPQPEPLRVNVGTSWPLHTPKTAPGTGPESLAHWAMETWTSTTWTLVTTERLLWRSCSCYGEGGKRLTPRTCVPIPGCSDAPFKKEDLQWCPTRRMPRKTKNSLDERVFRFLSHSARRISLWACFARRNVLRVLASLFLFLKAAKLLIAAKPLIAVLRKTKKTARRRDSRNGLISSCEAPL